MVAGRVLALYVCQAAALELSGCAQQKAMKSSVKSSSALVRGTPPCIGCLKRPTPIVSRRDVLDSKKAMIARGPTQTLARTVLRYR